MRDLMRGRYVIAGIGHTAFGRLPGRSTISMNVEACRHALDDAGIDKTAIDALFVKVPTSKYDAMYGQLLAEALRLQPKVGGVWDQGGATNIAMISFACMSIDAGQCNAALVCLADNPKTGTRQAYEKGWGDDAAYGWFSIAAGYALIAQRHMAEFGTTSEQLGAIAIACRNNGAKNPHAHLRLPLTLDQYLKSPYVIEPLRRDDICLVSDGAAAVVVMSQKRAHELNVQAPVSILGFGQGQTSWDVPLRPVLTSTCARESAETAFRMAGVDSKDIDVAQIYDCYTIAALMTLEDYGFCKKGHGGRFVADGAIAPDGDLPINTSGGLLSETGMPGLQMVMEGVRQMRGTSVNQVPNAQKCIVSNQGGIMTTHSTLILGQ
jgi:acetyl-CoA acetyltransferase